MVSVSDYTENPPEMPVRFVWSSKYSWQKNAPCADWRTALETSEGSAGGSALQVELGVQNGLLALHDIPGLQLGNEIVCADALDEHAEALAGLALLSIQQQRALHHLKDLLLGVDLVNDSA